ncbi:hypothetical protein [Prochlorococcus sp. MIT 1223]|uniref:hypothetical protein n=1 Tax=Prochlorococcus sp. MIT 1223 TaxID=3096217 RepID=UPI002A75BF18|nr:hypothetical protein [Prochlorococcus sp. MIT 1223]
MAKKESSITPTRQGWLWKWQEPESTLSIIPKSKTKKLAAQAKLANIDAEKAIARAYKIEITRAKAIGEAMFKSGKALRYSFLSSGRQILLRTKVLFRQVEPRIKEKRSR